MRSAGSLSLLIALALALAPALAACSDGGDGLQDQDAGFTVDAGEVGDAGMTRDAAPRPYTGTVALIGGSGGTTGNDFAIAKLMSGVVTFELSDLAAGELRVRESGGVVFLMDVEAGRVTMHFIAQDLPLADTFELPDGANAKPVDVAYLPQRDRVFISLEGRPELVMFDRKVKPFVPQAIDLSAYDPDGNPNAGPLLSDGGQILVGLSRLAGTGSSLERGMPARILAIDGQSLQVTSTLELPQTDLSPGMVFDDRGDLVVALGAQRWEDAGGGGMTPAFDGALYKLRRLTTRYGDPELFISEQMLGGNLAKFLFLGQRRMLVLVDISADQHQLLDIELSTMSSTTSTVTRRLETEPSVAFSLCANPAGSVIVSGKAKDGNRGEHGIAFLDPMTGAPRNAILPDPGFRPLTCVVASPR